MKITKLSALGAAIIGLGLAGCVNPDVVTERTVEDRNLGCQDIANQLGQIQQIKADAQAGKGVSTANVAAAVLFWPAVIGNNINANNALDAASKREIVLIDLAEEKNCNISLN